MVPHEFTLGMRNILLVQFLLIAALPGHASLFRLQLIRIWRTINAPFLQKRKTRRKGSRFWEIDMTKFEP
jgi:hypothetical protein